MLGAKTLHDKKIIKNNVPYPLSPKIMTFRRTFFLDAMLNLWKIRQNLDQNRNCCRLRNNFLKQILPTKITRIDKQTVRRVHSEILGVQELGHRVMFLGKTLPS